MTTEPTFEYSQYVLLPLGHRFRIAAWILRDLLSLAVIASLMAALAASVIGIWYVGAVFFIHLFG